MSYVSKTLPVHIIREIRKSISDAGSTGDLIVSVIIRPSSTTMFKHPLGQPKPSSMWSLRGKGERKLV